MGDRREEGVEGRRGRRKEGGRREKEGGREQGIEGRGAKREEGGKTKEEVEE